MTASTPSLRALAVLAASFLAASSLAACAGPSSRPVVAAAAIDSASCNAPPDAQHAQLVVGYGSLMQDESRRRTSPNAGPAFPVRVAGFRRGWYERGGRADFGTTFLGVARDRDGRMNAVVYEVSPEELRETDRREASYCRTSVPLPELASAGPKLPDWNDAQAWIYLSPPRSLAAPDAAHPIVQSYVDLFVGGCLEQEERYGLREFARECIRTTQGWSADWVNDRIYPRRPFIFEPRAGRIDRLLAEDVGGAFLHARLEGGAH